ncbi:hypothetical protein M8818_001737 [Zalaria obscura]|uniref:Uncharacterized protein n=1 Tax=Zalaria obscura TaxID=2024903 RepID=A0ACC3SJU2_9PEZI
MFTTEIRWLVQDGRARNASYSLRSKDYKPTAGRPFHGYMLEQVRKINTVYPPVLPTSALHMPQSIFSHFSKQGAPVLSHGCRSLYHDWARISCRSIPDKTACCPVLAPTTENGPFSNVTWARE